MRVLCFLVFLAVAAPAEAQVNVITTAAPVLSLNPDARSGGMGELGLATAPDVHSGLFNLAKTPFASARSAIGLNYAPWLSSISPGMYLLEAAGYHRFDTNQAISAGIRYFNLGDVDVSDYSGNHLLTAHPREYSLDLGYSRKLSTRTGVGVTFRYVNSSLATGTINGTNYQAGTAFAADLSFFYNGLDASGQGLTAGATLSNLGTKIGYSTGEKDFLPANLGAGLAYTGVFDAENKITVGVDVYKLLVPASDSSGDALSGLGQGFGTSAYRFSLGAEYTFLRDFSLRAGYYLETAAEGGTRYFTAGAGVKLGGLGVDFSYIAPQGSGVSRELLSNSVRLGVAFGL